MRVPVNQPIIAPDAVKYVNEALETGWISSAGRFVDAFEQQFAQYLGVKHATTVSNGTTALHLALAVLGIGEGDEVLIPDQTIISCPFAALYQGAKPVLVDVEAATGNMDPNLIEAKITPRTKAIMVVHLFGHPANLEPILAIAKKHNLFVIEDAAEAHGAEYKGQKVGSFGDVATFSFYANKIVTTGEGGMLVTNNDHLHAQAATMKNLSHKPGQRFFHEQIGYNYRLTNLQAALGLAHLEQIDHYLDLKLKMAKLYQDLLSDVPEIELPTQQPYAKNVYWMFNVLVSQNSSISRDSLMAKLQEAGIETRTYFYPLHIQPVLKPHITVNQNEFKVSQDLSERGFYLPSGLAITEAEITYVATTIKKIMSGA